jgi:multidrug efflux pump
MEENKKQSGLREFGLSSFSVDNATSVFLLTFMILLFGMYSYNTLPKESFPEISFPKIFVNTVYFGNSAEDIENLITRKIEKELGSVSEIKTITSSSLQDYSLITAEFDTDIDMEDAKQKVKDAVDKAQSELPNDLTKEPEVIDVNLSEIPIMTVNLSGDFSNAQLRAWAEYLEDEIEDLQEISSVALKGVMDREMKIDVDIQAMQARQVSFGDIENAIRSENLTMSGGEVIGNDFRRNVRVVGEFKNAEELGNMIVKSENQLPVYLRDIATVTYGFKEKTSIARSDQQPVVSLDVIKRSGENLLDASDNIKLVVEKAKQEKFPKSLEVSIFNDQSVQTRDMVSNLENSIISGVILVVLVLLFFLGLRNASFVGLAIPLSMLMGFLILQALGYTMNMVVLFSLILALGMLVDNGIVVVENIYRYRQEGYSAIAAAKYGVGEVAMPIISSTATTLAAFVPLAFWPGLMGSFMKFLPITLIVVLASSLFVALVINPVIAARFMVVDERAQTPEIRRRRVRNTLIFAAIMFLVAAIGHFKDIIWVRNIFFTTGAITLFNFFVLRPVSFWFQDVALPLLEKAYYKTVQFSVSKIGSLVVVLGTFILLIVSFMLMGMKQPKVTLFPSADPLFVNAFIEMPLGTDIEATNRLVKDLEARVSDAMIPYKPIVESILTQIGENTGDPGAEPTFGASPNKARITVAFVPSQERGDLSTLNAMHDMRESLKGIPGVKISVQQNQDGPPTGKPINIEVRGDDINKLIQTSLDMTEYINKLNIPGIEELQKDIKLGKPELLVQIDRERARLFQLSTYSVADALRTSIFGKEVSKFKDGDEDHPIVIRVDEKSRNNITDLLNQPVTFRDASNGKIVQIPISAVVKTSYSSSFNSINRKDQQRVVTLYSNVLDGYNANEIVQELKTELSNFEMPEGYAYAFTGEQEEMADQVAFLSMALAIALAAVFFIIVAQFNSISSPLIIMISVLFSTIGVFMGYVFFDMDIVIIMTGVGIISLAGVVVNNAIVLIDYTVLLLHRLVIDKGLDNIYQLEREDARKAVMDGGATRLRPVLLTAITTVLGLIPLALGLNINFFTLFSETDPQFFLGGDNAKFWGTMAWTVVYGLIFSTFLTLVVVPAMFWLIYLFKVWMKKRFGGVTTPTQHNAAGLEAGS